MTNPQKTEGLSAGEALDAMIAGHGVIDRLGDKWRVLGGFLEVDEVGDPSGWRRDHAWMFPDCAPFKLAAPPDTYEEKELPFPCLGGDVVYAGNLKEVYNALRKDLFDLEKRLEARLEGK